MPRKLVPRDDPPEAIDLAEVGGGIIQDTPGAGTHPQAAQAGSPEPSPSYTLGTWAGLDNWKCGYCEYATTIGENEVQWHIAESHPDRR